MEKSETYYGKAEGKRLDHTFGLSNAKRGLGSSFRMKFQPGSREKNSDAGIILLNPRNGGLEGTPSSSERTDRYEQESLWPLFNKSLFKRAETSESASSWRTRGGTLGLERSRGTLSPGGW